MQMIQSDSTWSEFMVHVVVTTRHKLVYAVPLQPGHAMACVGTTKSGTELLQLCLGWDNHSQIKQICSHFSDTAQVFERNCSCLFLMIWCVVSTPKKWSRVSQGGPTIHFCEDLKNQLGTEFPDHGWWLIKLIKLKIPVIVETYTYLHIYKYICHIISPK